MAANWASLDLPTGVAGDMLLAALLDLGVPQRVIDEPLAALGLQSSYRLNVSSGSSAGLRGQHLSVELLEASPPHRHWAELKPQLQQACCNWGFSSAQWRWGGEASSSSTLKC